MEDWQKQHIQKHLVDLIKNTLCNTELVAKLQAADLLGQDDSEIISLPNQTPCQMSKKLYDILTTRVGSFDILIECLQETKQSGAVKILKEHSILHRHCGRISFDKSRLLGTGGFGTKVYKGSFGVRDVAIKVLNTDLVDIPRVQKEITFFVRLDSHPNILRYFATEVHDNYIYIALEWCLINLQDEIKTRIFNQEPTLILCKCTEGLAYLHKNKIIHGDVKPVNILFNFNGEVKLADFGMSKEIPRDASCVSLGSGIPGTLDWMAPEILTLILDEEVQPNYKMTTACDIFSLGCVFFYVLTNGGHPFGKIAQRQYQITQHQPKDLALLTDTRWVNLITNMIDSFPKNRPSAEEILLKYFDLAPTKLCTKFIPPPPSLPPSTLFALPSPLFEFQNSNKRYKPLQLFKGTSVSFVDLENVRNSLIYAYLSNTRQNKALVLKHKQEYVKTLLDKNPQILREDAPLFVDKMHISLIKFLIHSGANVLAKTREGESCLHRMVTYLSASELDEVVSILVTLDVSKFPEARPKWEDTLSGWVKKQYSTLQLLLFENDLKNKANVVQVDHKIKTYIMFSIVERIEWHDSTFQNLLSAGADFDTRNGKQETILHVAVRSKRSVKFIKFLLENHVCNFMAQNTAGSTFLHYASNFYDKKDYFEIIRFLANSPLELQNIFHIKDDEGLLPVHYAVRLHQGIHFTLKMFQKGGMNLSAETNFETTFKYAWTEGKGVQEVIDLISMELNPLLTNYCGDTIVHIVACRGSSQEFQDITKYFVAKGHSKVFKMSNHCRTTPLHFAVCNKNLDEDVIKSIIEYSDVNACNHAKMSVLHLAVKAKRTLDFVKHLITIGANPLVYDDMERGLTHEAAAAGLIEHLEYFVELGCDIKKIDKYGNNTLHQALFIETPHDSKLLLEIIQFCVGKDIWRNSKFMSKQIAKNYAIERGITDTNVLSALTSHSCKYV